MRWLISLAGCAIIFAQIATALGDESKTPKFHLAPVNATWHANPDGTFQLTLPRSTSIQLNLDRKYKIYAYVDDDGSTAGKDVHGLVFDPDDHQSSVSFTIGKDAHPQDEKSILKMYPGTSVTRGEQVVNGKKVLLLQYEDPPHLCCEFQVTVNGSKGGEHPLCVTLIANTPERLSALKTSFSNIIFNEGPESPQQ
jgi:hypothetical protein